MLDRQHATIDQRQFFLDADRRIRLNILASGVVPPDVPPGIAALYRAARLWIQQYGFLAVTKAREKVEEIRRKGDHDGADTWLRIIVAIGTLRDDD